MSDPTTTALNAEQRDQYRPIPGFPGYRVGDDGTVQSCWKQVSRGYGGGSYYVQGETWRSLKPRRNPQGHLSVTLRRDARSHSRWVHRLVLEAFVGPCPAGMECCHNNGDPADNRLVNLRWGTPRANRADAIAHGTIARGERNGSHKLTEAEVRTIWAWKGRAAGGQVARGFGISHTAVRHIWTGRSWKWLTSTAC
jgi:hypothetical protein